MATQKSQCSRQPFCAIIAFACPAVRLRLAASSILWRQRRSFCGPLLRPFFASRLPPAPRSNLTPLWATTIFCRSKAGFRSPANCTTTARPSMPSWKSTAAGFRAGPGPALPAGFAHQYPQTHLHPRLFHRARMERPPAGRKRQSPRRTIAGPRPDDQKRSAAGGRLGPHSGGLAGVSRIFRRRTIDDSKYSAARLQTALFPDNPLALEGIDLLYLSSERAANLSVGQVNALMEWLQRGGHLVLGVEQLTDVNATPWLRELLPCDLTSTINFELPRSALMNGPRACVIALAERTAAETRPGVHAAPTAALAQADRPLHASHRASAESKEAWIDDPEFAAAPLQVATGSLRDGTYLIGDAAAPLAVEGLRGRGRITVLTFSPSASRLFRGRTGDGFGPGWPAFPPARFQIPYGNVRASRLSSDGIFGAMIDTKQVRKLPLGWLLALLAAYLVVIGPLDQYWLKKINRQMLTWVTFPCYVLIFSGADLLHRLPSSRRRTGMERVERGRYSARHRPRRAARADLRFHLFADQSRITNWPATRNSPPCAANTWAISAATRKAAAPPSCRRAIILTRDAYRARLDQPTVRQRLGPAGSRCP